MFRIQYISVFVVAKTCLIVVTEFRRRHTAAYRYSTR